MQAKGGKQSNKTPKKAPKVKKCVPTEISKPQGVLEAKIVCKASREEACSRKISQTMKSDQNVSSQLSKSEDALLGRVRSPMASQEDQGPSQKGVNLEVDARGAIAFGFQSWDSGYEVLISFSGLSKSFLCSPLTHLTVVYVTEEKGQPDEDLTTLSIPEITNIDEEKNPLLCSIYAPDIYDNLRFAEVCTVADFE